MLNYNPPPAIQVCIEKSVRADRIDKSILLKTINASADDPNFGEADGSRQYVGHVVKIPDEWLTILPLYGFSAQQIDDDDCTDIQAASLIIALSGLSRQVTVSMGNWQSMSVSGDLKARAAKYLPIMERAAATYSVPLALIEAVATVESRFHPNALSPKGAIGLMQLMPGTARDLDVNPYLPDDNIMGGAKLLSQLLAKYTGNMDFAIAAYNAGPGNVDAYGGVPPFPETQKYVPNVEDYYQTYQQKQP